TDRIDHASEVAAKPLRETPATQRAKPTTTEEHLTTVDTGGVHPNPHLTGPRLGLRHGPDGDLLRAPIPAKLRRRHRHRAPPWVETDRGVSLLPDCRTRTA